MSATGATQALLRLLTWLSPAFPIGAFAYSGGLERAVCDRLVSDAASLEGWISMAMRKGPGWNDAVFLTESHRVHGDAMRLETVVALAGALSGSRERYMETTLLGEAFVAAARAWPHPVLDRLSGRPAYPVAVGAIAGAHGIALEPVLTAYLHAQATQNVSAGIRLGVCGQRDGVSVLAALEERIAAIAALAANSTLDDLGSATVRAEIASLRHEVQDTRLFRS